MRGKDYRSQVLSNLAPPFTALSGQPSLHKTLTFPLLSFLQVQKQSPQCEDESPVPSRAARGAVLGRVCTCPRFLT